jgi:hypothetical protein
MLQRPSLACCGSAIETTANQFEQVGDGDDPGDVARLDHDKTTDRAASHHVGRLTHRRRWFDRHSRIRLQASSAETVGAMVLTPLVITSCTRMDASSSREGNRGTYPRFPSGLRLRIRAHPGAYRAPRALVTVPIRQVRMGAGLVPLRYGKHRTDHHPEFESHAAWKTGSAAEDQIAGAFFRSTGE